MNEDANPLVAMHCLAAADALVLTQTRTRTRTLTP